MLETPESINFFENLNRSLSPKRFAGYKTRGGALDDFAKYLWNKKLCESLCPCFQILEVSFRNTVHLEIGVAIKDPNWILNESGIFYTSEQEAIKNSKKSLMDEGAPVDEDYLVAEMKFGFWTSLLNSNYERLWPKIIGGVFPNMPRTMRTRADASILMNGVRKLRNAALHHHSIWHWSDLKDRHGKMRNLIEFICKSSAAMANEVDRFPLIYSSGMSECQKSASKILKSVQKPGDLAVS